MKKTPLILTALVLVILGVLIYKSTTTKNNMPNNNETQVDIHDGTYIIAGQNVTLKNGISEVDAAPGSASKIITRYFGNDLRYDANNDGVLDDVFLLTQSTGGSGLFYYVVALTHTPTGDFGSDGILLGDRISPQTINLDEANGKKNVIVVNYADRKANESFATAPSVGKSIWLKLDTITMKWGEVVQNFEGEADTVKMSLSMKNWEWVSTGYSDGKKVTPRTEKKFVLTLKSDKTFSATTDCNGVGGEYTTNGNKITFTKMISTMMYCEGSQEADFTKMISEVQSYFFTAKGELVLDLKFDTGSVIFK